MMPNISKQSDTEILPDHVAIIMDGNGRWAKSKGMPRGAGHKKGAESVKQALLACEELGISYLTIYAFSSENWNRPADEVSDLMSLLSFYLDNELEKLNKRGVCLKIIGSQEGLSKSILKKIDKAENLTKSNNKLFLNIALSYGSKDEIVNAAKKILEQVQAGNLNIEDIDTKIFEQYLYTNGMPEPDLLIRTGGEKRLSNFLLWQLAYTELFFTDTLWPDFSKEEFFKAVEDFTTRERRYGTF